MRTASRCREILGISYRNADGTIAHNPDRPQLEDLDAMPWATKIYKRDMDVTRYNVPFLLHPYIALYSTRGCPAQCTFCLWPQTLSGHAWRKRSTDDVAAEMKWAKENFPQVKEFFFDDDTFNIQKARTVELCEKLKPLGITWSCTSRVTTDRETLKAMKDAGCRLLIVGYESGDPQILKNIKKGATVERARAFTKDCHDLGLTIHADFILGLPGETRESIRNTINFAKSLDCETIQVSIAHAYPGTEFYDFAEKNGFITNHDMSDSGGHQMAHIEYPGLPAEYVLEMVHRFYDEYYFRPKAAARVVWKAIVNRDVPRLYQEAKSFMKLRAQRNAGSGEAATGRKDHAGRERRSLTGVLLSGTEAASGPPLPLAICPGPSSQRCRVCNKYRRSFSVKKSCSSQMQMKNSICENGDDPTPIHHPRHRDAHLGAW